MKHNLLFTSKLPVRIVCSELKIMIVKLQLQIKYVFNSFI